MSEGAMIDVEAARALYADHDSAHGFDHVLRVWRLAQRIGEREGADMGLLQTATLLHDIGRAEEQKTGQSHAELGAAQAREILRGYPPECVERVAEIIAQHRFRGDQGPTSLEARVLYDADKLDAIGAIGVARAYAIAGRHNQRLWAEVAPSYAARPPQAGRDDLGAEEHTPVHEYLFKLARLQDRMYTVTGREMAAERHRYMAAFFARLEREVRGEL